MKRIFGNTLKTITIIGVAALLGWYTHQSFGIIGILTNVVFFTMGSLWMATWERKSKLEPTLDAQSLSETVIVASAVENMENAETQETVSEKISTE